VAPDEVPDRWKRVASARGRKGNFLLRPGELVVARQDARQVRAILRDWKPDPERHTREVVVLTLPGAQDDRDGKAVLAALAKVRKATKNRARVAPNHVLVGESGGPNAYRGTPRIRGGPATRPRPAKRPASLLDLDGDGARARGRAAAVVGVLDTGLWPQKWLSRQVALRSGEQEVLDAEPDGFLDTEAGHGTFVTGLVLQVAPTARVHVVKVLDSEGIGDDVSVAAGLERLPEPVQILNLSLGGYTGDDQPPLALAEKLLELRADGTVIVAAAGNDGTARPFWPAALKHVIAVGAVEPDGADWRRADFSNHGWWVDACTIGADVLSAFVDITTNVLPEGGTVDFDEWAYWGGTSMAAPIVAGAIAALVARGSTPADAAAEVLARGARAPLPDFPLATRIDVTLPS
jgi:subtilisin family serine protease